MTEPVSNKVQLSGYTGIQAGIVGTPDYTVSTQNRASVKNDTYLNAGAVLGGEANYKGTFARAEVGLGTAFSGKVEVGHSFDIGKNMGLELSAKAETSRSLINKSEISASAGVSHSYNYENKNVHQVAESEANTDWKPGVSRLGAAAKFTFGSKNAKFGIGFESGIRKGMVPDADLEATSVLYQNEQKISGAMSNASVRDSKAAYYGTPTISADVKLNKHLSFNASADLNQGQAGIRWNF